MEFAKIVARHRRIHVMLGVIVHLPVMEARHRMEGEGAAAQTEVRHMILQPDVLRVVA